MLIISNRAIYVTKELKSRKENKFVGTLSFM